MNLRGAAKASAAVALALLLALAGCGGDSGVKAGATVNVYVAAPLCGGAKRELASEGGRAGDVRVKVLCLAPEREGSNLDLYGVAENARRATEDSTAVGYIEERGPTSPYARPILKAAGIAFLSSSSGKVAMTQLLEAIAQADPGSLRESIRTGLSQG